MCGQAKNFAEVCDRLLNRCWRPYLPEAAIFRVVEEGSCKAISAVIKRGRLDQQQLLASSLLGNIDQICRFSFHVTQCKPWCSQPLTLDRQRRAANQTWWTKDLTVSHLTEPHAG